MQSVTGPPGLSLSKVTVFPITGHPDSPFNCTILNQTTMSLEVECIEGFDGGQPQWFLLEVRDGQTGQLQANISNKFPVFSVNHLSPGQVLKLVVVAVNNKGRSESVFLEGYTLKVAEKQTGNVINHPRRSSMTS